MIHVDDTVGVIHDYQTASPELIIKDEVIAVWNGKESGTKNCVDYARSCGKDVIWINPHELIQINMVKANEVM